MTCMCQIINSMCYGLNLSPILNVSQLGRFLVKEMATHSNILAWRTPGNHLRSLDAPGRGNLAGEETKSPPQPRPQEGHGAPSCPSSSLCTWKQASAFPYTCAQFICFPATGIFYFSKLGLSFPVGTMGPLPGSQLQEEQSQGSAWAPCSLRPASHPHVLRGCQHAQHGRGTPASPPPLCSL